MKRKPMENVTEALVPIYVDAHLKQESGKVYWWLDRNCLGPSLSSKVIPSWQMLYYIVLTTCCMSEHDKYLKASGGFPICDAQL